MLVYYCLIFILAVLAFICNKKGTKKALIVFFFVSWILLSFVEGLRAYDVGFDTDVYVDKFIGAVSFKAEIGYEIVESSVKLFTSNPTVFLIVVALLINGLVLSAIYIYSHTPIASVLLYMLMYFYFNTYDVARQYFAVGISLVAFYFAVRRRWLFFVLMIVFAMCFHSSAMVCLVLAGAAFVYGENMDEEALQMENPAVAVYRNRAIRVQTLALVLTIASSFACYLLLGKIIEIAVLIFPKYAYYLSGPESHLLKEGGGISQPVVYTSILLALFVFVPAENKYKRMLFVPSCAAVVFSFLQMRVLHAARFLSYFDIYSIFTIPCILKYGKFPEKLRKVFVIMASLICIAFMTYYLMNDYHGVNNYSFVFNS